MPEGAGTQRLQPLGLAGEAAHFTMVAADGTIGTGAAAPTSVTLFEQGLVQVLEAAASGLEPNQPYLLALASQADGGGKLEPLSDFGTNPAGSATIVVGGYTENTPVGPALRRMGITDNLDLPSKRGASVVNYLVAKGMNPSLISVQGFGDTHPVAPNDTTEGRAKNRRLDITLTGDGT